MKKYCSRTDSKTSNPSITGGFTVSKFSALKFTYNYISEDNSDILYI